MHEKENLTSQKVTLLSIRRRMSVCIWVFNILTCRVQIQVKENEQKKSRTYVLSVICKLQNAGSRRVRVSYCVYRYEKVNPQ